MPSKRLITKPFTYFFSLSWFKKIITIIILLTVSLIAYRLLNPPDPRSKYQFATAQYDSITEVVAESGNVQNSGVTPIYSTTTGVVEQVLVQNGDIVTADQLLFTVKSTATQTEQEQALATYMTAKNALESAKATQLALQAEMFGKWDSYKELAESDDYEEEDGTPKSDQRNLPEFHIPQKQWQAAEATYKNQQQIVQEKSLAASVAWQKYQTTQDSEVYSVLGGTVQNLALSRRDHITANPQQTPALILIDDTVPTVIKLSINENDINKVQVGQVATVEFDALDELSFQASVDRVDIAPTTNQDIIEYSIYLTLSDPSDQIQRGMTADVEITTNQKDHVLTLPVSTIKPYQGGKAVRTLNSEGEEEFLPVQIGIRGDGKAEIISGIEEGMEVITAQIGEQTSSSGGLF